MKLRKKIKYNENKQHREPFRWLWRKPKRANICIKHMIIIDKRFATKSKNIMSNFKLLSRFYLWVLVTPRRIPGYKNSLFCNLGNFSNFSSDNWYFWPSLAQIQGFGIWYFCCLIRVYQKVWYSNNIYVTIVLIGKLHNDSSVGFLLQKNW